MDFPSAYQALKTGNCTVAALNPPTSYTAEAEGYVVTSSLTTLGVPSTTASSFPTRRSITAVMCW